jgi:hypothetical protein
LWSASAAILAALTQACGAAHGGGFTGQPDAVDASDLPRDDAGAGDDDRGDDEASATTFVDDAGGGSTTCRPGTYSGMYMGTNDSSKVGGPKDFPISGPMAITLVRSAEQRGELLLMVTSGATFDAVWGGVMTADASNGLIVIHSTLAGQLDCSNGEFTATSTDANWTLIGIPAGMATVQFTGKYDDASGTIAGDFTIGATIATSTGTWTATVQAAGDL